MGKKKYLSFFIFNINQAERIRYLSRRVEELDFGNRSLHASLLLRCLSLAPDGSLSLSIPEGIALREAAAREASSSEHFSAKEENAHNGNMHNAMETDAAGNTVEKQNAAGNPDVNTKAVLPSLLDYHALKALFPDFDPFSNDVLETTTSSSGNEQSKYIEEMRREMAREKVLMNLYKEWIA